jgi:hypothetical protein
LGDRHRTRRVFLIDDGGDTVRVIERVVDAVPVGREEAEERRARTIASMSDVEPGWRWTGSDIPATKPFFGGLNVSADGRIWVLRHVRAQHVQVDAAAAAELPPARRPYEWVEPRVYDVFEPDGRYLGEVRLPERASFLQASGDRVWSMQASPEGIPQLVRYRVVFP